MKFLEFGKQTGLLSPIYVAEGEEAFFRDRVVSTIRAKIEMPELNDTRIEGDELKGKLSDFRDTLSTLPFMSEMRLVRVYEFYPTEKEYEQFLKSYFENPCPSTILLIVNSGSGKGKTAVSWNRKPNVTYVDCAKESEDILVRWCSGTLKRNGITPEGDAVTRMVRYSNYDTARMDMEIKKLVHLVDGKLTPEDVEEYIVKDVDYKTYELTQAASRRSYKTFVEIMNELLQKNFDENAILAFLTSHYRTLYEVSFARGTDAEIAKSLGIKPYAVQKNKETAVRLGREKVKDYYSYLFDLSSSIKSGEVSKESALASAIAKIFFD